MKKILCFFVVIFLIGCGIHNLRTYKPLVTGDKTMTVPAGGLYLTGSLKDTLTKNGWRLYVDTDTIGNEKESSHKSTSKKKLRSRYELFVNSQRMAADGWTQYDISVIDNDKEEEIMSLSGAGFESEITSKFEDWLKYGKIQDNYSEQNINKQEVSK